MPFNSHHWATPIFLILFNYLSLYLSINLSIFLPIHISITVSVYLSITISICRSINQYSIAADAGASIGLVSLLTVELSMSCLLTFYSNYLLEEITFWMPYSLLLLLLVFVIVKPFSLVKERILLEVNSSLQSPRQSAVHKIIWNKKLAAFDFDLLL